jgi:short-subunit dehydrogenase
MVNKKQTALITGASEGMGAALASCFAKGGFDLVLVARNAGKLHALAADLSDTHGIKVLCMPCDLTVRTAAADLLAKVKAEKINVDVLVNCAGVLEHGSFVTMPLERQQGMIDLNLSALTAMLSHFVPPMVERGFGRVLNVASIAAFQPVPTLAVYAATKAFVLSLTESLAVELEGTGVSATALCPGVTATNMMAKAQDGSPGLNIPAALVGDAAQVAEQGYHSCLRGDVVVVLGAVNLATTLASRATPKWLLRKIGGALSRKVVK